MIQWRDVLIPANRNLLPISQNSVPVFFRVSFIIYRWDGKSTTPGAFDDIDGKRAAWCALFFGTIQQKSGYRISATKWCFIAPAIRSSVLIPKLYVFVGRGHDPADQVAHFALARFNESAFISLRFGGVMTPPYERQVLGLTS